MKNNIHDKIKQICNKQDIYFWSLKSQFEKRAEQYFIFGKPECERYGETQRYNLYIWVINEDKNGKFIGNSNVSFSENASESEIKDRIEKAIIAAKLIKNPFYNIPKEKFQYPNFENVDKSIKDNPSNAIKNLSTIISEKSEKFNDVRLSTTELFVSSIEENFSSCYGNEYTFNRTKILLEGVFLAGQNLETESFFTKQSVFIDDLELEKILENQAIYAKDNMVATTLKTGKYNVVFGLEALDSFFDFYYTHANAKAVFNKFSLLKLNENINLNNNNNISSQPLTIKVDPFVKGGLYSSISDQFGIPLKSYTLIENNIVKNFICELPYSQYLNIPYTGPATNFIINGGNDTIEDLTKDDDTVLLLRFSAFSPKAITGDFSSEIRLGYITKNGKKVPIKGGSVSGNIRNLIHTLKMTKNITKSHNYIGPDGIYLEGVDIAGI